MSNHTLLFAKNARFLARESKFAKGVQDAKVHVFAILVVILFFSYSSLYYFQVSSYGTAVVFAILDFIFILGVFPTLGDFRESIILSAEGIIIEGEVINCRSAFYGEFPGAQLTVKFVSPEGNVIQDVVDVDCPPSAWPIGKRCSVLYLRDDIYEVL